MTTKEEIANRDKSHLVEGLSRLPRPDLYGYRKALECAGVDVLEYEEFGSYQGDWLARVRFPSGDSYYVSGSYGSCTGCDAFEAEFGYIDNEPQDQLSAFGRCYLTNCMTYDEARAEASKNLSWDREAQHMVDWLDAQEQNKDRT